jgi:hypothetical protein
MGWAGVKVGLRVLSVSLSLTVMQLSVNRGLTSSLIPLLGVRRVLGIFLDLTPPD